MPSPWLTLSECPLARQAEALRAARQPVAFRCADCQHPFRLRRAALRVVWAVAGCRGRQRRVPAVARGAALPGTLSPAAPSAPTCTCRHHRALLRWAAEVGPLLCFRVLWEYVVVVSHPLAIHQLLRATPGVSARFSAACISSQQ